MTHLLLEIVLWMLLAYFAGCVIGTALRKLFASGEAAAMREAAATPRAMGKAAEAPVVVEKNL